MFDENFPFDIFILIIVRCSVRELACLSMTSRCFYRRTRQTLMHMYFQTASVTTDILSLVEANLENSECVYYLQYSRSNTSFRIYARFPRLFKFVFEKKIINEDGTELRVRQKFYEHSSNRLIDTVKYNIVNEWDVMNVLLFPDTRKIRMLIG